MKLIAVKPFSYNTRRLQAGDVFEAKSESDRKLLLAIKKVRSLEDRPEEKIPAPPKALIEKIKEKAPEVIEQPEPVKEPEVAEVPEVTPEPEKEPEVIPEPVKEPEVEEVPAKEPETEKEPAKFVRSNSTTGRGRNRKN